jgi:hypothetical protein
VATQALDQGAQTAIAAAMATIDKLKPDAPITLNAGVDSGNLATLQNILKVADGIKTGNWAEITMAAGPELAIIASNIILSVLLSPALADALSPAVAAMIHNDAAAAQLAIQSALNGDVVGLAQVIFTWYETHFIDEPCALLGKDVQDAVCSKLSDAIKTISDAGGDLAKKLLGMGEDVLKWLGVWNFADSVATDVWNKLKSAIDDIGHFLGLGSSDNSWTPPADCGSSPSDYAKGVYANDYLACVTDATNASVAGPISTAASAAMQNTCVADLDHCIDPKNRGKSNEASTCSAMFGSLSDLSNQVSSAMGTAADAYTNSAGVIGFVSAQFQHAKDNGLAFGPASSGMPDFCSPDFWNSNMQSQYEAKCAGFVSQQFPSVSKSATPAKACQPLATMNNRATSACAISLRATLDGSAAAGASLTGPGSVFCQAQGQLMKDNPCKFTKPRIPIDPAGQTIPDLSGLDCNNGPWKPTAGGPVIPFPKPPTFGPVGSSGSIGVLPFDPKLPIGGLPNFPVSSSGSNPINPNNPKLPPPIVSGLPKGGIGGGQGRSGGSSGVTEANGCSGNSPAADCPPQRGAPKKPPSILGALPKGGNSSGSNGVEGNSGNSPTVKILTNPTTTTKNAARTIPIAPVRPSISVTNTQRSPGLGSSSGTNSAMDRLGGGGFGGSGSSGGFAGSRRAPSPTQPSAAKPPAPSNGPVDFGGCPGCGRQNNGVIVR